MKIKHAALKRCAEDNKYHNDATFSSKNYQAVHFFGPGRSTFRWLAGFSECNIFGLGMQFFAMQEKTMHGSPSTTFDGEITGGKIDFF